MTQISADFLVIGGGIAGMSAAAELARDASVILLEAEEQLGYHSTGRSAAIFISNYGNATLRALSAAAHPALAGELLGESVLSARGEMLVVQEHELDMLANYLEGATGLETLTPDEACALVPVLRRENIAAAVIERGAEDIDVDTLLQGCTRLFKARRGQVIQGARVTALARESGLWQARADELTVKAPVLINAGGAWADHVGALAGLPPIGLQPTRRSAALMAVPPECQPLTHWPLFGSVAEDGQGWYAKPDGERLMISPADEDPVEAHDAWPDDMVLAEGLHRFEQMVNIPLVKPSHTWAGLRSFAPDRSPIVGFDPASEGFFWLAGQGGYGVQTAPALAALTRALATGAKAGHPDSLLAAVSPARLR
ncbi:NAD(P)/FAD-dependent oxidoreductase [Lentibacter algarum]|uniref:NAD(P)/FAD-dependent oxidoreductase n=1 Tax=Lentibacter algarum TaxID=576131 RepID=UPI0023F0B9A5|nr:FAD-binding oxidoreductase [Lentibacter algarum]